MGRSRAPATATYRDRVVDEVAAQVGARLDALAAAGVALDTLGPPGELAGRAAAVIPGARHEYDAAYGPFYDTAGLSQWFGVSRQALSERVRRHSLLACRTADGHLVYPAFQFGRDATVRRGLAPVLRALAGLDGWAVAAWLTTATPALRGTSALDWLVLTDDVGSVLALAEADAARWAA